jgi:uncharacterized protein
MSFTRREFLETTAALTVTAASLQAATDPKTGMPQRTLGRTGATVSVLAFGSGSRFLMYKEEDQALAALTRAIDGGINYLDTAYGYGNGKSEERIGKLMPQRRKSVFLATKMNTRGYDDTMRLFEGSLKRLQTSQVDLVHIHSLTGPDDLAAIERPDGILKALYKIREQKGARFIGVTSHTDPEVLKTALERHDFDCTQMALNAARMGNSGPTPTSFEQTALAVALRKKMGVLAMKIFGQEKLNGKAPAEKLIQYSMSLPVAATVIGMPQLEHIDFNLKVAKAFKPMSNDELRRLGDSLSTQHKAAIDLYFDGHVDA